MKDYRKVVFALIAAAAVNMIAALCLIPGLPEQVPMHFNYKFEIDQMGSPWFLAVVPAITLAFTIGIAIEQKIRGKDYANNKPLTIFSVCFVALFIALGWTLYAMSGTGAQLGDKATVPLHLVIGLGMSVLFVVLGNYAPTVQPNRTFGFKMPITFSSDEVWRRTHRFGGKVMVIGGLFSAACTLIGFFIGADWLMLAGLMLAIFGSLIVITVYAHKVAKK